MKFGRRMVLKGLGGAVLGMPLLESFSKRAVAAGANETYAIFFRQANGVAAAQSYTLNGAVKHTDPERFWPMAEGALTPANVQGRTLEELNAHASKLLVVGNVTMKDFDYGDGHARGALQCLTAQGPVVAGAGGDSEANGESIDHRIGRELNAGARDSLFLYAGPNGGWLGGPCISYRGPNQRRAAVADPLQAYKTITGGASASMPDASALQGKRQKSVNDLVRTQLNRLIQHPRLGKADKDRLDLHLTSIRELEVSLGCQLSLDAEKVLDGGQAILTSPNGEDRMQLTRMHMDVAAIAVACGYTRSVAIQFGDGNDSSTRFLNPDNPNERWENFHYISHRILAHGGEGTEIVGADVMHSKIDRYFAQTFKHLLDRLSAYQLPGGGTLLDAGVAVWFDDLATGPAHGATGCPFILAGSCNGYFKQNTFVKLPKGLNHAQLLNTIGTAVGVNKAGAPLDDFGDGSLLKGVLPELKA
ncbi:MAG: DUF1552 domain-containing protein [Polyangiaceae bacterium]|nr:DUF1552 domain-containing protein [Polyangiaceae bacterium]